MDRQTPTTTYQTENGTIEYARVKDRLLEFHKGQKCSIETRCEFYPDSGFAMFMAVAKNEKGEFSGHSLCKVTDETLTEKLFEKHETIAVGRALAFAGYLATGEIASAEEMGQYIPKSKPEEEKPVTTAEVNELKAKWFSKYGESHTGKDKGYIKTQFKLWACDHAKEDIPDVDDFRNWSRDGLTKCQEALA